MGDPEEDPCGLRRRLEVACEPPMTRADIAAMLGIPVETLSSILDDPSYVISPEDYITIATNLPTIPMHKHFRGNTQNWAVYFVEKPEWTYADVEALDNSQFGVQVVIFVCDPLYPDRVKSDGPYDLSTFDIVNVIEAATDGDYFRLLTIADYYATVEYPYAP